MESFFSQNTSILFVIALFYTAISGLNLTTRLRVGLVYSFSYLAILFSSLSYCAILAGSIVVLFLILEVFNADEKLVKIFSIPYKIVDFLFRIIFEYYGWFYAATVFIVLATARSGIGSFGTQIIGIASMIGALLLLSRSPFSIKPVSKTLDALTAKHAMSDYRLHEENHEKFKILAQMEDHTFFSRKETRHAITFVQVAKGIKKHLSLRHLSHPIETTKMVFQRGYGTIEMQLIRTVGIELGSYHYRIRRKTFEVLYSNMILNGHIRQFGKDSEARKHARDWIAQSYIDNVSVKFGIREFFPSDESTVEQIFEKPLHELSNEEFFVWCLGLPYFKIGVGKRAVSRHQEVIEQFNLNEKLVFEALKRVNGKPQGDSTSS